MTAFRSLLALVASWAGPILAALHPDHSSAGDRTFAHVPRAHHSEMPEPEPPIRLRELVKQEQVPPPQVPFPGVLRAAPQWDERDDEAVQSAARLSMARNNALLCSYRAGAAGQMAASRPAPLST
jgi:hypothetical protein